MEKSKAEARWITEKKMPGHLGRVEDGTLKLAVQGHTVLIQKHGLEERRKSNEDVTDTVDPEEFMKEKFDARFVSEGNIGKALRSQAEPPQRKK